MLADDLAEWVAAQQPEALSDAEVPRLKIHVLDSLACALSGMHSPQMQNVGNYVAAAGGDGSTTLFGGQRSSVDRAAFHNTAAIRYLDFNDTFIAEGEGCHPSDNLGAVIAVAEQNHRSGIELLLAMAIAYQVQGRFSQRAPVRARGYDHTAQSIIGATCAVNRLYDNDVDVGRNALSIAVTAHNQLRVTRTGRLSHWKGLASASAAAASVRSALMARAGITGPDPVFEGAKGFNEVVAGISGIEWADESLDVIHETSIKKHNAEFNAQTAVEAAIEVALEQGLRRSEDIASVEVETFAAGFHIIGGGDEGPKDVAETKEAADHSLPYMVAAGMIAGRLMPDQYSAEMLGNPDVIALMGKVRVHHNEQFDRAFPKLLPTRVVVRDAAGRSFERSLDCYRGFKSDPMGWEEVEQKLYALCSAQHGREYLEEVVTVVAQLDQATTVDPLVSLIRRC